MNSIKIEIDHETRPYQKPIEKKTFAQVKQALWDYDKELNFGTQKQKDMAKRNIPAFKALEGALNKYFVN